MIKVMKFTSYDEYETWANDRQENDRTIDEIVCVVDEGYRLSVDLTTACKKPTTAIRRLFKELGGIPELDGWQDGMTEAIENGYYSDSDPRNYAWEVVNYGDDDWDEYYVFLTVYRAESEPESESESAAANKSNGDADNLTAAERKNMTKTMTKTEYCLTRPPMATYADSAFSGIAIHGVEYDAGESYLYISRTYGTSATYHRVKVRDGVYGSTFRIGGRTYKTADVIRIY